MWQFIVLQNNYICILHIKSYRWQRFNRLSSLHNNLVEGPGEELWSDFKVHDVKKQTRGEEKNKTKQKTIKLDQWFLKLITQQKHLHS